MSLETGKRFGPYEITDRIGAGGMGEVWRARDTNLKREVALKVLPQAFVTDADRLARFQREAEILASLNHPNIAQVYGLEKADGASAIVMELVEGPTLADRIKEGPIPPDEALGIARQIADALEAAHGRQIVHRDLKPPNVKVRSDGTVKVLDFGISKPIDATTISGGSPAMTTPAVTQTGVILGTAAYMSPEQARGRFVDQRTDIWAFGCLLFEMLTGQPVFGGEDVMLTLARVLDRDADLQSIPETISPEVRRTIELCLEKDPNKRIADIRDVRLSLEGRFQIALTHSAVAPARQPIRRRAFIPAAALVLGALAGVVGTAIVAPGTQDTQDHVRRFSLTLPAERTLTLSSGRLVGLSPDGQTLVYRAEEGGVLKLFQRRLDSFETTVIPGSEGVEGELLFFSPDSRSVAFRVGGDLMRALLTGGRPLPIARITPDTREASWGTDDSILIGQRSTAGLLRLRLDGGEPESIPVPEALVAAGINQFWYPQLLDDGRAVLVTAATGMSQDAGSLVVIDLVTSETSAIMPLANFGYVLPSGYLLFVRGSDLWAARFDLERLDVVGDATVVLRGVRVEGGGAVQVTVADNGTIAYIPGTLSSVSAYQLVWVDRDGREQPVGPPGTYQDLSVSPDGMRVAVSAFAGGNWDIWVMDLARGGMSRLTSDPGLDDRPIWSPDGTQVLFESRRGAGASIYRRSANGTTPEEALLSGIPNAEIWPAALISDDNAVIIDHATDLVERVSLLRLDEDRSLTPIIEESDDVRRPALSPDGRWIAYESLETGRAEVYVRPFPDVDAERSQVSTDGGQGPVWSGDGRSLFFGRSGVLFEATIDMNPAFRASTPSMVLDGAYAIAPGTWGVSPDGGRFLVRKPITSDADASDERPRAEINVILDFTEELNRVLARE